MKKSFAHRWMSAFLCLASTSLAFGATADTPQSRYRTGTSEVRLTFFATDQNYHSVATVQTTDFAVVDQDSIVRNFNSFSRTDWMNVQVSVILDASDSVSRQFKDEVATTLQWIRRSDGIPEENLSLIEFHGMRPRLICGGNCRTAQVEDHLPSATVGLTPLFDALIFASDRIPKDSDPHTRRVFVVFSDGQDTISLHSADEALAAVLARDIQIYAVDLRPPGLASNGVFLLKKFANVTGGRYFTTRQGADKVYDALLDDLQATYTVTYKLPGHAPGFHSVRLLPTHNLNLHFHCRDGYEYPASGQ